LLADVACYVRSATGFGAGRNGGPSIFQKDDRLTLPPNDAPEISVIIPLVNSVEDIRGALDALARQQDVRQEVLVVSRLGDEANRAVASSHPGTVILATARDATIPQMRAIGFDHARAPAIAVIEDHVIVPERWSRRLLDALDAGADVAGGPVDNAATEAGVDWAAFLCEYSACLPPLEGGESPWLPGNNVVYRKALLERYRDVIAEGKWENRLHDAMRADGVKLIMLPDLIVGHKMHYTFGLYMSQRYLYARSYAGARVAQKPLLVRIAYGTAAFALAPLMFVRTVRAILKKGRHVDRLWPSLPMIGAFVCSWGAGEIIGYWFGAGSSLSKVR